MMTPSMTIATIDSGHRIQLPAEWARALGLERLVALEKTADGILIRPCRMATWEDVFASKLPVGSPSSEQDAAEVSRDALLF
jgi:bifunctional DNA-binding transcriptional regulator/antitoxin component of YhaV-PrlF toxin-antitoxin module